MVSVIENNRRISNITKSISKILTEWNPIQIDPSELLDDEYSRYIPELSSMVLGEADNKQIFNRLRNIRVESMQLEADDDHDLKIADKIVSLVKNPDFS